MNYYVLDNNNIIPLGNSLEMVQDTLEHMPQYQELEMHATLVEIVFLDDKYYLADDPEYIAKKEEAERERIASLFLTRGDVFDGLIKARMIDEAFVLNIINQMPEETDEQKLNKMLSKNACQNALNFHRSHPMVDYIGENLNISSHNLDMFFDTNDYHYLLAETEGNG